MISVCHMAGALLLCGLFFYDIFWVFGTPVMVTVAKSLDAPIKLVFPRAGQMRQFYPATSIEIRVPQCGDAHTPDVCECLRAPHAHRVR